MPNGGARARTPAAPEEGKDRQFVTALARGLEVLRCIGPGDRHLANQEIAQRTAPLVLPDDGEVRVFSCSGAAFQMGRDRLVGEIGPRLLNLVGNVRSAMTLS